MSCVGSGLDIFYSENIITYTYGRLLIPTGNSVVGESPLGFVRQW